MALFAISDLHLSLGTNKPMDVFGARWQNYEERLASNWTDMVKEDDTVLIGGDISWAMHLTEALDDLRFIHELPGRKIMIKGNHDFWWGTNGKVEHFLAQHGLTRINLLKNNAYEVENVVICGTRGWILPNHSEFKQHDRIIFEREKGRLERSLQHGISLKNDDSTPLIVVIHYPPILEDGRSTAFTQILEKYDATHCVYGHLHGHGHVRAFEGQLNDVRYSLTSADYIGFKPLRL